MGPLMINMAFMPLYMWEMWDVTPVTHGRTVESRAVFSLSWIRNYISSWYEIRAQGNIQESSSSAWEGTFLKCRRDGKAGYFQYFCENLVFRNTDTMTCTRQCSRTRTLTGSRWWCWSGSTPLARPPSSGATFSSDPTLSTISQLYKHWVGVGGRYLLENDFPGMRIGPEPTTDNFHIIRWRFV